MQGIREFVLKETLGGMNIHNIKFLLYFIAI